MDRQHVRALTGIRFFAALWVVVYHVFLHNRGVLEQHFPAVATALGPFAIAGARGVDLFFLLSGYVLALNYLPAMGRRLDLRAVGRFLWLRLARIWPLYALVIVAAGGLKLLRHALWGSAPVGDVTWTMLVKQLLMVQKWFSLPGERDSWVGPAWSLSAEWLAYLLFPLLVLAVMRLGRSLPAPVLFVVALAALAPLMAVFAHREPVERYVWLARIVCEFLAGMLLHVAVARVRVTPGVRRRAGAVAALSLVATVVWLYVALELGVDRPADWAVLGFVPLVGGLAMASGRLAGLLSSRALVLGGGLSYALYLVHSPLLFLLRDATTYTRLALDPVTRLYVETASIVVLVAIAWALFRFVEEPARRRMRALVGARRAPAPSEPEGVRAA